MYSNGVGDHTIEGTGDGIIPWIFNARSQDAIVCIDDVACMRILRMFNEPDGKELLKAKLGWT